MNQPEPPRSPPQDERRPLNLGNPAQPDRETLRKLAQAGLSKRGLIVASDRKTAKEIQAELQREQAEKERSFVEPPKESRWAEVFAVIKRQWPLAIGLVVLVVTGLLSRSLDAAAWAGGIVLALGLFLQYVARRRGSGSSKGPKGPAS
jgi:hypothetical protein